MIELVDKDSAAEIMHHAKKIRSLVRKFYHANCVLAARVFASDLLSEVAELEHVAKEIEESEAENG